jgi:tetratricopeptide (TPR) repeat protein
MSQQDLADRTGISVRNIGRIETDRTSMLRSSTAQLLADAFDLQGPERDRFLDAAGGRITTGSTVPAQLPPDTPAFTGREAELARIAAAADASGPTVICAISGMPGVGKTALAVHGAHQLASRFPDGQLFLDLHAHTPGQEPAAPAGALAALLTADGVDSRQLPDTVDGRATLWRHRLAGRRVLLVIDNAADSDQVAPLLPGHGGCLVLVTSRKHLADLPGRVVTVALPVLTSRHAREMFRTIAPHAVSDPSSDVDELLSLTGGLPLAISLLARVYTRHRAWALADLLSETRARLLGIAAESATIAAAFDLSYRHLSAGHQRTFRLLGLHPGPHVDAHAASTLAGLPLAEAIEHLDALHGDNLLTEVSYRRYTMHDLIRQYARALADADPAETRRAAVDRLLDYYQLGGALAEAQLSLYPRAASTAPGTAGVEAPGITTATRALAWLRTERANLLAGLAVTGDPRRVVALSAGLASLLRLDGPWAEARATHHAAAEVAGRAGDRLGRANALVDLGDLLCRMGDHAHALPALREAVNLAREVGDRAALGRALNNLGIVLYVTADYADAAESLREALGLGRQLGDRLAVATTLANLGNVRRLTGDYQGAAEAQQQALSLYREMSNPQGEATALANLGNVLRLTGDYRGAAEAQQQAFRLYRELGNRQGQANALIYLGEVQQATGDLASAGEAFDRAMVMYHDMGDRIGLARALTCGAIVWRHSGDHDRAGQALHQALQVYRDLGDRGGEVETINEIGTLCRIRGDLAESRTRHRQAMELARDIGSEWDEAHALAGLGRVALAEGDLEHGTDLLRDALSLFRRLGTAEADEVSVELGALPTRDHGERQRP